LKKDVAKQSKARQEAREKKGSAITAVEPQITLTTEKASNASHHDPPDLPPKTPAGLGLFSPASGEPSAGVELRDTPPPADLNPLAAGNDGTGSFGRSSRRSRGTVSYTEPNLRDKMRRPTKELVDAVTDDRHHRASSVKIEDDAKARAGAEAALKSDKNKIRTVVVKREEVDIGMLADFAGSPLGSKSNGSTLELPITVLTDRKRRTSTAPKLQEPPIPGVADSVEVDDKGRETNQGTKPVQNSPDDLATTMEKLDIFEGPSSSPQPETAPEEKRKTMPGISRRHSSITAFTRNSVFPGDGRCEEPDQAASKTTAPRSHPLNRPGRASRKVGRGACSTSEFENLKSATSSTNLTEASVGGTRSERVAARRRSMML
jgi:hypothetical protein